MKLKTNYKYDASELTAIFQLLEPYLAPSVQVVSPYYVLMHDLLPNFDVIHLPPQRTRKAGQCIVFPGWLHVYFLRLLMENPLGFKGDAAWRSFQQTCYANLIKDIDSMISQFKAKAAEDVNQHLRLTTEDLRMIAQGIMKMTDVESALRSIHQVEPKKIENEQDKHRVV